MGGVGIGACVEVRHAGCLLFGCFDGWWEQVAIDIHVKEENTSYPLIEQQCRPRFDLLPLVASIGRGRGPYS